MNDNPSSDSEDKEPTSAGQPTAPTTSIVRILITLTILAAVIVGGGYWWILGGGEELFGSLTRPAFVKAQATVMWNGERVDSALIVAEPFSTRCRTAIGFDQPDGTVIFRTDTGGQYADGMDAGTYKLTVAAYGASQMASAPPLLTPAKYASMSTTDLVITVDSDPAKNSFLLELEGEAPTRSSRPAGGGPPGGRAARPTDGDDDSGQDESDRPQADSAAVDERSKLKTPAAGTTNEPASE